MKLDDNKKTLIKRILAGIMAVIVLGLGIGFSYYLTTGFSKDASPAATPDNSQYVDSSVEVLDANEGPNEILVNTAFILIEIILIVLIIYVLVRKRVG